MTPAAAKPSKLERSFRAPQRGPAGLSGFGGLEFLDLSCVSLFSPFSHVSPVLLFSFEDLSFFLKLFEPAEPTSAQRLRGPRRVDKNTQIYV